MMIQIVWDKVYVTRDKSHQSVNDQMVAVYKVKLRINVDTATSRFESKDKNYQGIKTFNHINKRRVLRVSFLFCSSQ